MSTLDVGPNVSSTKILMWRTIVISYADWFRHFLHVMRSTVFWIMLLTIVMVLADWLNWSIAVSVLADLKSGAPKNPQFGVVAMALYFCAAIIFVLALMDIAVTSHRFVILNENPTLFSRNVAKSYYWRYCGKCFLILAVATAPLLIIFAFIALNIDFELPFDIDVAVPAVGSVILLAMHVNFVRLSLVLAAEATETVRLTWVQSLKLTRGNALRLVLGLFVCGYLPEFMINILLECVGLVKTEMSSIEVLITTGESDVFVRHAVRHQILAAVALMFFPIGIQFLSRSYQQLVPTIKTADVAR